MEDYKKPFSVAAALRYGFYETFEEFFFILKVILYQIAIMVGGALVLGLAVLPFLLSSRFDDSIIATVAVMTAWIAYLMLFALIHWGSNAIYLDFVMVGKKSLAGMQKPLRYILSACVADIVFAVLISIGLCFFVIPGLYFLTLFMYYRYIMIETECGIIEAFKRSAALTKGYRPYLLGVNLLICILHMGLAIPLAGALIIYPALTLTNMYIYKKLIENKGNSEDNRTDVYTDMLQFN